MKVTFRKDQRLGITIPVLQQEWENYSPDAQEAILLEWEAVRGIIPDRIKEIEGYIDTMQMQLNTEENFQVSCDLNDKIADLASVINDLWLWFRYNGASISKPHN
ncbi:hypothetical protein ACFQPF_17195 [Fictibacillus iocasae]|uniref:Radical SAM protein n=1 Tax=Fictibacillus iocasae TaxID=2715437 RepID=A0ABW2NVT3_9BACL